MPGVAKHRQRRPIKQPAQWDPLTRVERVRKGQGRAQGGQSPGGCRGSVPRGMSGTRCSQHPCHLEPPSPPAQAPPSQLGPQGPRHHGDMTGRCGKGTWNDGVVRIWRGGTRHPEWGRVSCPVGVQATQVAHSEPPCLSLETLHCHTLCLSCPVLAPRCLGC